MGTIDIKAKEYFSDAARFADAFNFLIYSGEPVIQPDMLDELDATEIVNVYGNNAETQLQKFRDVLKLYQAMQDDRAVYLVLGIEEQTSVHYAMPVRNMVYDAMNYAAQVKGISDKHREANDRMTRAEFLSGFLKSDVLKPVITLVVSLSPQKWDGPLSIHEMLNTNDERILAFVADYKLNLIEPASISEQDFEKFRTGLGALMQFIKHKGDKDISGIAASTRMRSVDRDTADLIKELSGLQIDYEAKGDTINMWAAFENALQQAENKGINQGKVESAQNVARRFKLSVEEAMDAVGILKSDWVTYAPLVEAGLNTSVLR